MTHYDALTNNLPCLVVIEACTIAQTGLHTLLSQCKYAISIYPNLPPAPELCDTHSILIGPSFGDPHALQLAREARAQVQAQGRRDVGIVLLSPHANHDILLQDAAWSGVSACVQTPLTQTSHLLDALSAVLAGRILIPAVFARPASAPEPLSQRELEVLRLMADHMTNNEIASQLHVAGDTVKQHVKHIFAKLQVNNRRDAIYRARHLGWLS